MSNSQINLPKTAFSMKANLPVREPEILEYWQKINLYREAVQELDQSLRRLDSEDPVKYDFALFGLGVFEGF